MNRKNSEKPSNEKYMAGANSKQPIPQQQYARFSRTSAHAVPQGQQRSQTTPSSYNRNMSNASQQTRRSGAPNGAQQQTRRMSVANGARQQTRRAGVANGARQQTRRMNTPNGASAQRYRQGVQNAAPSQTRRMDVPNATRQGAQRQRSQVPPQYVQRNRQGQYAPYGAANRNNRSSQIPLNQQQRYAMAGGQYSRSSNNYAVSGNPKFVGYSLQEKEPMSVGSKIAIAVILVLVIVLGIFVGLTAKSALTIKDSASLASRSVTALKSDITSENYSAATQDVKTLSNSVSTIKSELETPQINLIGSVPLISHDFATAKKYVNSIDTMCTGALIPLVSSFEKYPLGSLLENGAINVTNFNGLLDTIETCVPALKTSVNEIKNLEDFENQQIQSYVSKYTDKIDPYLDSFDSYITLIPLARVLVGDGNQSYVLVSQNLAETRSRGGFPGAVGTIEMTNGKLSVGEFSSAATSLAGLYDTISEDDKTVFGTGTDAVEARDTSRNPDFTAVASHWLASYNANNGVSKNALVSLTPEVVQKIIAITGPITLSNGQVLDSTNTVAYLSHGIYWQYFTEYSGEQANEITDALFKEAANNAFSKLMSNMNKSTILKFVDMLAGSITDKSMLLYMTDPAKEQVILNNNAGGALSSDTTNPTLGVYFNLREASKLGWYADMNTTIGNATKNADGTTSYEVTTKVSNALTQAEFDSASVKSDYLLNNDGDISPAIYLFAPAGGTITNVVTDGSCVPFYGTYDGLNLSCIWRPSVIPEQTITITYTITCAAGATTDLTLDTTPMLTKYR